MVVCEMRENGYNMADITASGSEWPDDRLLSLMNINLPIVQAPMAGASGTAMAIAVCASGGLGSLPCAMLTPDQVKEQLQEVRAATSAPVNLNFFCHDTPRADLETDRRWRERIATYCAEFAVSPATPGAASGRRPFDDEMCAVVEALTPEVVSFHFGLPQEPLLERVRRSGCVILSSATTVAEARWLEARGCHAIIAQGCEAGGHRGMFLTEDVATQPGTMALVPQIADAVDVPVLAAGGIADARGIAAAFALGASGVQIGTAYLLTPEALISEVHRHALLSTSDDQTALTNVFSGRPARGIVNRLMRELGPMSEIAPAFPLAGAALAPLRTAGAGDFAPLWSGQAAALARPEGAGELTRQLALDARALMGSLGGGLQRQ